MEFGLAREELLKKSRRETQLDFASLDGRPFPATRARPGRIRIPAIVVSPGTTRPAPQGRQESHTYGAVLN